MERLKDYIDHTIAPALQGDGGWIELESVEEDCACVVLRGECSKCMIAERCMKWVASEVKKELKLDIRICFQRKRPFFWDV